MNDGDETVGELPDTADPYTLLGVDHEADARTIKRAYVRLIRRHRPEDDPEAFQRIREAFELASVGVNTRGGSPRSTPRRQPSPPPSPPAPEPSPPRGCEPVAATPWHPTAEPRPPQAPPPTTPIPSAWHPTAATPDPVVPPPSPSPPPGPSWAPERSPEARLLEDAPDPETVVRQMIAEDDVAGIALLLEGHPVRGARLAPYNDESAVFLAIGYYAWIDPRVARCHYDRYAPLGAANDEGLHDHCQQSLECAQSVQDTSILPRCPAPLLRAIRSAGTLLWVHVQLPLHELHDDVLRRPDDYCTFIDHALRACPDLVLQLDRLVGQIDTLAERPLHYEVDPYVKQALDAAESKLDRDFLESFSSLLGGLALFATIPAFFVVGWWGFAFLLAGLALTVGTTYLYDDRLYRRYVRPHVAHVAAYVGASAEEITAVLKRITRAADSVGRFRSEIEEDYAVDWCAALCRTRQAITAG